MGEIDTVALVLRILVGATIAAHGYNHLWGGGGLAGTTRWFDSLGMRPARLHATLSGVGELGCGAALAIGLLTPLAAAFVVGAMVTAGVTAHRRNGFFVFKDGVEYVVVLAVVSVAIGILGPGAVSIDHLVGLDTIWAGAVGGLLSGGLGLIGALVLLAATWRPDRQQQKSI